MTQFLSSLAFFKSPLFVTIAVAFLVHGAAMFGRHLSAAVAVTFVTEGLDALTQLALAIAALQRWRSKIQPLTLTAKPAIPLVAVPTEVLATVAPHLTPNPEISK
jgi:hypothetical protein